MTGPGVMTMYSSGTGADLTTGAKTWLTAINNLFPDTLTFTFPSGGEVIDSASGDVTGVWSGGVGGTVVGAAGSDVYAQGVGARVVWNSSAIVNGRRVRGSTYLVPLSSGIFAITGAVDAAVVTDVQTKCNAFVAGGGSTMVVWSRPTPTSPIGNAGSVTSCTFTGKTSWLRSRRT